MSVQTVTSPAQNTGDSVAGRDGLIAFALAILMLLPAIVDGSVTNWPNNNDNMMRLVQVRDLLAGQGWYDYTQYRMGLDGGFVMHWSRIVDLPIAAMILGVFQMTGSWPSGELAAGILWPSLLLAVSLLTIVKSARLLGGEQAVFPAAFIGAISLYSIGIFAPGALDHHNLQLTLCLIALWAMIGESLARQGFAAATAIALTLATGMETLPLVAAACAAVAFDFLVQGKIRAPFATGFGFGIAAVSTTLFLATTAPDYWFAVYCDAFSLAQLSVAVVGGGGLALIVTLPVSRKSATARLAGLGVLATMLAAIVILAYPQCLADPYADLDGRLKTLWLSAIGEAQSVVSIWLNDPVMFAKYYATPLAALAVLITLNITRFPDREALIIIGFLFVAVLVSFWQVRGGNFAVALAAIPLAVWVGQKRASASASTNIRSTLAMVFAWVVSLNASWTVAAQAINNASAPAGDSLVQQQAVIAGSANCHSDQALSVLASLDSANVVAVSNLGPAILKHTHHRVLAGPYHRNVDGNLAAMDIFLNPLGDARRTIAEIGIDYIAHCPSDDEASVLARVEPHGLLAALMRNEPPPWLSIVSKTSEKPIKIYKIQRN